MSDELRRIPLRDVLTSLGFSQWKERKGGSEWYGRCPIHQAKKNNTSFSFNQDGRWHCFSCEAKGKGAIDLVMKLRNCNFKEATDWLKALSPQPAIQSQPETTAQDRQCQPDSGENPEFHGTYEKYFLPYAESEWLIQRGLSEETCKHFGVGIYNNPTRQSIYKNMVMLPIRRFADSVLVGYLARRTQPVQGEPKYLFPKGAQKGLEVFGASHLKGRKFRYGYLVESPFCVMKYHQLGFPAVSCYGWSVSQHQAGILSSLAKGWIYLPDRNKRATIGQILHLLGERCWVKCPEYPGDDPEGLTEQQVRELA